MCGFLKHYLPQFELEPGWKSVICTKLAWGHVLQRIKFTKSMRYIHLSFSKVAFKYNFRCDETATWCRSRITETPCAAKFLENVFKSIPNQAGRANLMILRRTSRYSLSYLPSTGSRPDHITPNRTCIRESFMQMLDKWLWGDVVQCLGPKSWDPLQKSPPAAEASTWDQAWIITSSGR